MVDFKRYEKSLVIIFVVVLLLMLIISVGYSLGILSKDPDGLERALIDYKGDSWFNGLPAPWNPILGGIENDYVAAIIGIVLIVSIIMVVFYFFVYLGKKKN